MELGGLDLRIKVVFSLGFDGLRIKAPSLVELDGFRTKAVFNLGFDGLRIEAD